LLNLLIFWVLEEAHERTVVVMVMVMVVTTMTMVCSYWHQTNYSCLFTEVIRNSSHSVIEYGAYSMHAAVKTR